MSLNRKSVTARMLTDHPAWVRLYDILFDGAEDLRGLAFDDRRARLEAWFRRVRPVCADLSPLIPFAEWAELTELRSGARARAQTSTEDQRRSEFMGQNQELFS